MKFSEKFYVGYSDITPKEELSDGALLKILENVAVMHASSVHDGLKDSSGRWFLTAYHVKLHHRPQHEEWVVAETWSRIMRGVSSSREFALYGKDGILAATALSNWARVDKSTGSLQRIPATLYEAYGSDPESEAFPDPWIERVPEEPAEYEKEHFFTVTRNYLDANHHMNNVYYYKLASLLLSDEEYEQVREFYIWYRRAIPYGAHFRALLHRDGNAFTVVFKSEDLTETYATLRFLI